MHTSTARAADKTHSETAPAASQIRILADDLTGACDAAAPFVRAGRAVRVWLGPSMDFAAPESVQALNTATRNLAPEDAAGIVAQAAARLPHTPGSRIFKKVDSALRGPIAAEVLALQQALDARAILFAPAFPATGRIVHRGVLQVHNSEGPVEKRSLRDLFPAGLHSQIALVSNAAGLNGALASGKSLLLCDAATQQDLDALARAAQSLPGLLLAGSAGLATALANLDGLAVSDACLPRAARVLLITGSTHPVTQEQLARLAAMPVSQRHTRLLRIEPAPGAELQIRETFTQHPPEALFLTGGDTAQLAAGALGAHSIFLRGEFAPGVPWGIAQGGLLDGRVVITKSGGFGSPDLLCDILNALERSAE
jgi:uncharacterized protein YgbK (DUF1537 family)